MLKYFSGLVLFLLFISSGCSQKSVSVDYDPSYATTRLKTFSFAKIQAEGISPLDVERVRNALKEVLAAKGYTERSEQGDFTVSFRIETMKNIPSNISLGVGTGASSGGTGIGLGASGQLRHDEAMLEVWMTDTAHDSVFWTVSIRTKIDKDAPPPRCAHQSSCHEYA